MARPADIEMKGSAGTTSVQLAGNAISCCCSLWKYTRSSPQAFLYSTSSYRRPRQGWNGWMTSNVCVATSLDGAVLNADQCAGGKLPWVAAGRVVGGELVSEPVRCAAQDRGLAE